MGWMSKNLQIFLKITILCLFKMQIPHHPFKYVARSFHGRSCYAGTPGHWMQILIEIWDSLLLPLFLFSCPAVSNSVAPWTAACQASLPLTISQRFPKLMSVQPCHPLSPSSPSALHLPLHQGLFQWVSCLYQMTKLLELQLQHQSFQ